MTALRRFTGVSERQLRDIISDLLRRSTQHELVLQTAADIVAASPDEPVTAICAWVRANIPYVSDPDDAEAISAPWVQIERVRSSGDFSVGSDCDDHAILTAALLLAAGYDARVVIVAQSSHELDHAFAAVNADGVWLDVDTTTNWPVGVATNPVRRIEIGPG